MPTLAEVMSQLEAKGSAQFRKTFARHGAPEPMFGVSIANLKTIAKGIKGEQELALELYETGNYDAMYLAGVVADGSRMTQQQLRGWAKRATCTPIAAHVVAVVACESKHAASLALKWMDARQERIACCGWYTYSGVVATRPDDALDLDEIRGLLDRVVAEIDDAANGVRYAMNGFVISVGGYVAPLLKAAKAAAKKLGVVEVDMGDTACQVPVATDYIKKIETMGRVGKKRKTMKC